jgi:hypothetical protein
MDTALRSAAAGLALRSASPRSDSLAAPRRPPKAAAR